MTARLDALDTEIHSIEAQIDDSIETLCAAQALRAQLDAERLTAIGRAAQGDPSAGPDLDALRERILATRRAVQDGEVAVTAARAGLTAVQAERRSAVTEVTGEHLAAGLPVRAALAELVEAQAGALVEVIRLFDVADCETVGLARHLGAPILHPSMRPFIVRRLSTLLNPTLPGERLGPAAAEPPLPVSNDAVTAGMREYLARSGGS